MAIENPLKHKESLRIGIMGGTFDPVHYGHLVLAEEARNKLKLDQVIFIPNGKAPHKDKEHILSPEVRYHMVSLAVADNEHFQVSRLEIDSETTSYTIHTLRKLRAHYGDQASLFFITGADTLLDLHNWFAFEEVLKLCTFVGATRPGYVSEAMLSEAHRLRETFNAQIELIAIPGLSISSTEIRERVKAGETIRYLVPDAVLNYIESEGIYG